VIDSQLKQRLVGAVVLIALGVIFIPLLLDGDYAPPDRGLQSSIPPAPRVVSVPPRHIPMPPQAPPEELRSSVAPPPPESDGPASPPPEAPPPAPPSAATPRVEQAPPSRPAATPAASGDSAPEPPAKFVVPPPHEPKRTPKRPESHPRPSAKAPQAPAGSHQAAAPKSGVARRPHAQAKETAITAWAVQVGRFSTESNATALRDKLRDSGYASFAEPDFERGAKSVRVLVGPELQRADAEALRAQLKRRLKLDAFVVSYP